MDGRSGDVKWKYRSRGEIFGSAEISSSGDKVLLNYKNGPLDPDTEHKTNRTMMFDNSGQILWDLKMGEAHFSPTGKYLITYNPQFGIGIKIYQSSDGKLLWNIPEDKLSVEQAVFTRDETRVLVNGMHMYTDAGKRLWSVRSPGIKSVKFENAATSGDGTTTVVIPSKNRTGKMTVVRIKEDAVDMNTIDLDTKPDLKDGYWDSVAVSDHGGMAFLVSMKSSKVRNKSEVDYIRLLAANGKGKKLWVHSLPMPDEPVKSLSMRNLPSDFLMITASLRNGSVIYFVDQSGKAIKTINMKVSAGKWASSGNGAWISAIVGSHVECFSTGIAVLESSPRRPNTK